MPYNADQKIVKKSFFAVTYPRLSFQSPRRPPTSTRTVLRITSLTRFGFKGVIEYLEDLVARIDAPLLVGKYPFLFQLSEFIILTPNLRGTLKNTGTCGVSVRRVELILASRIQPSAFRSRPGHGPSSGAGPLCALETDKYHSKLKLRDTQNICLRITVPGATFSHCLIIAFSSPAAGWALCHSTQVQSRQKKPPNHRDVQ